jgi:PleD family two-component response regulator
MVSKGAAMGGIDYVTKPIQQEVLRALVKSRLHYDRLT